MEASTENGRKNASIAQDTVAQFFYFLSWYLNHSIFNIEVYCISKKYFFFWIFLNSGLFQTFDVVLNNMNSQ